MVVDLTLPQMDGFEVCKQIKENPLTKHTKIIILTSRNKVEDVIKGMKMGADYYMVKPFSLEELEKRVKKLLKQ